MNADLMVSSPSLARTVAETLVGAGFTVQAQKIRLPGQALPPLLSGLNSDIVIVDSTVAHEQADLQAIEAMTFAKPQMYVILITDNSDKQLLFSAMRAGVREVLTLPLADRALGDALQRCAVHQAKLQAQMSLGSTQAKVVALLACKGGCGASFLATNLAYLMASEFSRTCALVDLDLQYGDASFYLGAGAAKNNISDLTHQIERLDAQLLLSCMHPVAPRLSLLAAPQDMETALSVTAMQLEKVLRLARQKHEVVVLDMHRAMDAVAIQALDMADVVYLVLDNTMPAVRDAKRQVKLFRSLGYADDKLRVLVNRYDSHGFVDLKSIEEAVGQPVVHTLPQQWAAATESISLGQPLVKTHPQNPVVDALRQVAAHLLQTEAPKTKTWLSRWVGVHA
jgi:pilus assembly protein CpaE